AASPALASLPQAAAPHPRLLDGARAALAKHGSQISARDLVAIADYSLHSAFPRFFLYAPDSGAVTALRVAHGRGSDPAHTGYLQRFSPQPGSAASSAGAYLTGETYVGQHGRSRRLIGLDPENSTAQARAIVIHGAWYCEPGVLQQTGKLGRSEGCFAFSADDAALVLDRLGPGHLLYSGRA
uniref:murein L,D-transpeptidase catalytic domain family protein n=1 Tax=Sandarakinorhabdus oryzae TaxID=2675220 RepID=UPI0012E2D3C8